MKAQQPSAAGRSRRGEHASLALPPLEERPPARRKARHAATPPRQCACALQTSVGGGEILNLFHSNEATKLYCGEIMQK